VTNGITPFPAAGRLTLIKQLKIALPNEQAVIQDALRILNQTMAPSQVVILISRWWSDGSDYLNQRDELFASETVDSLVQKIRTFEQFANDDAHRQNTI
jgi:hypothetical protein